MRREMLRALTIRWFFCGVLGVLRETSGKWNAFASTLAICCASSRNGLPKNETMPYQQISFGTNGIPVHCSHLCLCQLGTRTLKILEPCFRNSCQRSVDLVRFFGTRWAVSKVTAPVWLTNYSFVVCGEGAKGGVGEKKQVCLCEKVHVSAKHFSVRSHSEQSPVGSQNAHLRWTYVSPWVWTHSRPSSATYVI